MERILSQEEISALFSAMSSEGLRLGAGGESPGARKVSPYDFHRADRISQDQMRSLHLLHDYFGRSFASSLSAYLRALADVSLVSVDQMPYSEFLKLLPDPTLFANIALRSLQGNAALELNPSLVFPIIDKLLGGPGNPPVVHRALTEIEITVIEGVLKLALGDLKDAWRPAMDLDLALEGCATKPQMCQIVPPSDTVVTVSFRVSLGENSGMLNFCLPSRVLKGIRGKFDQQWHARQQKTAAGDDVRLLELVRTAPLRLTGQTPGGRLAVEDLLQAGVGDVLALDHGLDDWMTLCVGGVPKFVGKIVVRRGKKAFEVAGRMAG